MMGLAVCTKDGNVSLNPMSFTDSHSNAVLERLRYQRLVGHFCDVLIVVNDKKFSAHRMILAACSPYFDAVLRNNKIVKEKIIVNCQNTIAFELLLNYIYSGSVVIDRSVVTELLKLSNNFLIIKLKNYCAQYLERYIDAANCISVRNLAVKYNLTDLLKKSIAFFDSNINGCLLENSDILEYNIQQLRELITNPNYKNTIRPDVHLNLIVRWVGHDLDARESLFKELLKECAFSQVTPMRLERMLDYNPFFTQSENSLFIILQEMHNIGMSMEKYEVQYRNLVKKYSMDINVQLLRQNYYSPSNPDCSINNELIDVLENDNDENVNQQEIAYITSGAASNANFVDELHTQSVHFKDSSQTNINELQNTETNNCDDILQSSSHVKQTTSDSSEEVRQSLKLRINLSKISRTTGNIVDSSHKKRSLFEINHFRKKQKIMLQRRGQSSKNISMTPKTLLNIDEEPKTSFYNFKDDDDSTIIIFDEPDDINPESAYLLDETNNSILNSDQSLNDTIENKELQCDLCLFKYSNESQLRRHFSIVHSKSITYVCYLCRFECKWNREFYDHMRQHFPGPLYQCDKCPYRTERIHVLLSHCLTHTNEKPFKCPECEFCCRNKSNLVTHHRLHSGDRPFKCSECEKSFAIRSTYEQHVAVHSSEKPFVCHECDFKTKYQSHLISHRRIHTGDLFHCEVVDCDYSSPKKSQLAAHLRTHLAVRSHQCRICNRSFIEKSHLIRHERIHLAEKPFKCGSCDYASSRRDKLKEHIFKHHNTTGVAAKSGQGTSNSIQLYRRRYRRARQIAQITAQTKLIPSECFRPIQNDELIKMSESQTPQLSVAQDQQQKRQRSGSESATLPTRNLSMHVSSVPPIAIENLLQQHRLEGNVDFSMQQIDSEVQNNNNNDERYQQQSLILSNRPCSASLPRKDNYPESSPLSPSCYSLNDFHHHSHHLGHHLQHESPGTPDTDLSTPGPHLENLRTLNSVGNIFNNSSTEPTNVNLHHHFGAHHLSINERQFQALTSSVFAGNSDVLAPNILQNVEDPVQRPMSLPNYGGLNQIQQQMTQQSIQHYNLIDADQNPIQTEQQQPWS